MRHLAVLATLALAGASLGPVSLAAGGAARAADLAPAPAQSAVRQPVYGFLSEARIGVFAHDPWSPESGSADINAELLTIKPFVLGNDWDWVMPRFHVGASINTQGRTSHAYAGLTWNYDVTSAIFLEATLGGAVNNGVTGEVIPVDRNAVGCHVSFRESASLGYRLTQQISLMGTIEHFSNAGLCDRNRGVTNIGARLGYSF